MTEPITRVADPVSGAVLRGAVLRSQSVSLGGRPRDREEAATHPVVRHDATLTPAPASQRDDTARSRQAEMAEALAAGRQSGYREGWDQGLKEGREAGQREGAAAGRQEILVKAAGVITEAAQQAAQEAAQRASANVEQEAAQRWNQQKARLDALLAVLPQQISHRLEAAQDDMLALCMEALVHVLGQEAVQPEFIRAALRQAMHQVKARPLATVELNPGDLETLQGLPDWEQWCKQHAAGLQWIGSLRVETGGCIVSSPEGSLDARLDIQLQAFRSLLLASRSELASRPANDSVPQT
jgi:flagellar assembly protein FliH